MNCLGSRAERVTVVYHLRPSCWSRELNYQDKHSLNDTALKTQRGPSWNNLFVTCRPTEEQEGLFQHWLMKIRMRVKEEARAKGKLACSVIASIMQMTPLLSSIQWPRPKAKSRSLCCTRDDSCSSVARAPRVLTSNESVRERYCCEVHSVMSSPPWVFSMKTTLESELKLCPVRIICWPPRTEQPSMSCFSTKGSSCAERWAARTHRDNSRLDGLLLRLQQNTLNS